MEYKKPFGQYRCDPVGRFGSRAYVTDGTIGTFVGEAEYREKGYEPDFDLLPVDIDPNA